MLEMSVEEALAVLREDPEDPAAAADAPRRRPRLHQARPAGDDALGRRGAARQARVGAVEGRDGEDALHPRRADDRPPLRRHREAPRDAAAARRRRQHDARDRAQPRRDQAGRLGDRPRAGGRRGGRRARSRSGRPRRSPQRRDSFTGRFLRQVLARARWRRRSRPRGTSGYDGAAVLGACSRRSSSRSSRSSRRCCCREASPIRSSEGSSASGHGCRRAGSQSRRLFPSSSSCVEPTRPVTTDAARTRRSSGTGGCARRPCSSRRAPSSRRCATSRRRRSTRGRSR